MGVCETVMDEDEENFSIATAKDFKAHGAPLLMLMNIACMYMEELDTDPYMWGDADSDDDEDDDEEIDEDGGLDLPDTMKAAHFFPFKQFFTQAEAAALVASAEEGGELFDAMDAAYASWRKAMEEEEEEINE